MEMGNIRYLFNNKNKYICETLTEFEVQHVK